MLYLLKKEELNQTYYKVGFSRDKTTLEKRLKTYKKNNHTVLGIMKGSIYEETKYHDFMSDYGNKYKKTEWFNNISEKIINLIKRDFDEQIQHCIISYQPKLNINMVIKNDPLWAKKGALIEVQNCIDILEVNKTILPNNSMFKEFFDKGYLYKKEDNKTYINDVLIEYTK